MKTTSASVRNGVKSKAVSLPKAAKYLAKFVESESGASEAILGYLKRNSAALNELNAFHKEIRKVKFRWSGVDVCESVKSEGEVIADDDDEKKCKHKKKNKDGWVEDEVSDDLSRKGGGVGEEGCGRKRKKLAEEGRFGDSDERKAMKKRKKIKEEGN